MKSLKFVKMHLSPLSFILKLKTYELDIEYNMRLKNGLKIAFKKNLYESQSSDLS